MAWTNGKKLYRARDGWLLGVCAGVADSLGWQREVVRLLAVILLFTSLFWPAIVAYIVAGLILKPEPAKPFEAEGEAEFYEAYCGDRRAALARLKRAYDRLDKRIQHMEDRVTSEADWDRRFDRA